MEPCSLLEDMIFASAFWNFLILLGSSLLWVNSRWNRANLSKKESMIKQLLLLFALRSTRRMRPPLCASNQFIQSGHFRLTPCETHCLNLFLGCSLPVDFRAETKIFNEKFDVLFEFVNFIEKNKTSSFSFNTLGLKDCIIP